MPAELVQYVLTRNPADLGRDLLDLLITFYIFYRVALVIRGTRAMQVGVGLALVFVLYVVAELLHLRTVLTLLTAVLSSAILIGVVVFQSDIRRGLMRVGARARFGAAQSPEQKVIDNVVEAATTLARHRTGALITFEQDANLDEFVGSHTGHEIDAAVTTELLVTLFLPEAMNKLHDGAVIIRDLRVAKAGVFFPMPESKMSDESFGSRHRAAMGITEETDAIVIVVSEERGSISFCFNGNIISNLDGPKLRAALEGVFQPRRTKVRRAWWSRAAHEPASPQPQAAAAPPAPPSSVAAADSVPPPAPEPSGIESTPAPLRKRGDAEVSEPPKPLRKSSEGKEAKAGDSQSRPPTPLRKSSDSRAGESRGSEPPRSTRAAGLPELPRPPASVVPTPLRHLAPPPQRRDSAPTPEPVSVRHPGSTPMPRAEAPDSASREAEPPELKSTGTETPLPNDQEAKDSVHHEGGSR